MYKTFGILGLQNFGRKDEKTGSSRKKLNMLTGILMQRIQTDATLRKTQF